MNGLAPLSWSTLSSLRSFPGAPVITFDDALALMRLDAVLLSPGSTDDEGAD